PDFPLLNVDFYKDNRYVGIRRPCAADGRPVLSLRPSDECFAACRCSGSPAVKPKTSLRARRSGGSPASINCPGVSSKQFDEFLRKKSLENAHLLSGHNSPVLQRYRSSSGRSAGDVRSADAGEFSVDNSKEDDQRPKDGSVDFAKRTTPVHLCDNGTSSAKNSSHVITRKTITATKRVSSPLKEDAAAALTKASSMSESGGKRSDVSDSRTPPVTSADVETVGDEDPINSVCNPNPTSVVPNSGELYQPDAVMQRVEGDPTKVPSDASEELDPAPGDRSAAGGLLPDSRSLTQSPLRSDTSNYYRIVSFDMSGVEVTDDDLTKLEEELRDERAPNGHSLDASTLVEPVAADQVIPSRTAENVVNNNTGGRTSSEGLAVSVEMTGQQVVDNSIVLPASAGHATQDAGTARHDTCSGGGETQAAVEVKSKATAESGGREQGGIPQMMESTGGTLATTGRPNWDRQAGEQDAGATASNSGEGGALLTQEHGDPENSEPGAVGGKADAESVVVMSPTETRLGRVRPLWIQDEDAPICMNCGQEFTIFRRRHHCRACGKVSAGRR
ncbi:hypothetical protein BIW11_01275, partial [Tropilaelaps mercedesae]